MGTPGWATSRNGNTAVTCHLLQRKSRGRLFCVPHPPARDRSGFAPPAEITINNHHYHLRSQSSVAQRCCEVEYTLRHANETSAFWGRVIGPFCGSAIARA